MRKIYFHSFLGNGNTQNNIRIIRILLGGKAKSIEFISNELKQEHPIAVVIISGSGKASDILAYAHR